MERMRLDAGCPLRYAVSMRSLLPVLAIVAVLVSSGCKERKENKEGNNYTQVSAEDAEMNAAIAKAKASADDFVTALHARKPGTSEFHVKKPYKTPSGGHEHMWISVDGEKGGVLSGTIANEAEETREVTNGQKVTLRLQDISDWKYHDGKKLIGGFTIRYFLEKMPAKERDAFLREAGFDL